MMFHPPPGMGITEGVGAIRLTEMNTSPNDAGDGDATGTIT